MARPTTHLQSVKGLLINVHLKIRALMGPGLLDTARDLDISEFPRLVILHSRPSESSVQHDL